MRPVLRARRIILLGSVLLAGPFLVALPAPASAAAACHVDYQVRSEWPAGFTAGITLGNDGPEINGWTLTWTFPADGQTVAHGWNGDFGQVGRAVRVTNAAYNPVIPAGRTVELGFVGTHTGTNPVPTNFALNGQPCAVPGSGGNLPPTVELTTPRPGTALPARGDIALIATASDPDGTVTEVRFFVGSTPLGVDTASPYFGAWFAPSTPGPYVLTAVARDNSGAVTTSAPVPVTLVAAPPTSSPAPTP
ncbi:MAG TPA: cellulose binding domain-containing protein [Mycobacteriales bacterium]|nr:cellulose binding domain-containing protein [Mycobacteriales bacterium]